MARAIVDYGNLHSALKALCLVGADMPLPPIADRPADAVVLPVWRVRCLHAGAHSGWRHR